MIFNNSIFYYENNCFLGIYSELFLLTSILILITYLVLLDWKFKYKFILSSLTLKLTLFTIFILTLILINSINSNFYVFNLLLISNNFTTFIKIIISISTFICIVISKNYVKKEKIFQYEYFILILLSLLGIFTIVSSNDLITMYLAIELQSLSFYILASIKTFSNFSTEAGLKYFILGAFSSGMLLFGCSLIYGFTGITNFYDLNILFYNIKDLNNNLFLGVLIAILFISIGILFKLGAAPFHMWLPDVYEGAPTTVTAFFSIVPKIAMLILFLKLGINLFFVTSFYWKQLILYSALLSVTIGTFASLFQIKIKRLLAYSAISHMGFLLIAFFTLNINSSSSLLFYIIVYILLSISLFSIVLAIRKRNNNLKFKKINELVTLFKSNIMLSIIFSIVLFSVAGIPPLLGFYSKLYILFSIVEKKMYIISLTLILISVIGSMYYIRLIKLMFFKKIKYWNFLQEINTSLSYIVSFTFVSNIGFILYPELWIIKIQNLILYLYTNNLIWI